MEKPAHGRELLPGNSYGAATEATCGCQVDDSRITRNNPKHEGNLPTWAQTTRPISAVVIMDKSAAQAPTGAKHKQTNEQTNKQTNIQPQHTSNTSQPPSCAHLSRRAKYKGHAHGRNKSATCFFSFGFMTRKSFPPLRSHGSTQPHCCKLACQAEHQEFPCQVQL